MNQEQLDHMVEELHRMKKAYPALIREPHVSLEYVRRYFVDKIRKDIPCYLGYLTLAVRPNGEVIPGGCRWLSSAGNLRQKSLKQIVDSKEYRESIRQMFLKNCPGCACNHIINLYAHFPSVVEEIKWRFRRVS
jgi:MoaA/NifB/PqqE/SkfB family radical SAM enzyme